RAWAGGDVKVATDASSSGSNSGRKGGESASARDVPDPNAPPKRTGKRRKRRRGRKVYARDKAAAVGGESTAAPTIAGSGGANVPAPSSAQPQHAPSQDRRGDRAREDEPRRPGYVAGRAPDAPVYAALDLGTNNCRLLVAIPTRPGQFRVVDAFSRIVRLGEGLSNSGRLGQSAMDRAVEALKVCGDKLKARRVRRARLIATEACRSAENGDEFLERV